MFLVGNKAFAPPSRDRLCEMNSAACFAVLSRRVFSLLSLSCPGFSFPSSTLSASANYSHLSSNAPSSSTRSPVSSDRVGRWQQRFKRLLLKTLHESVSSDSEVSDKTCNDIPPILSLSQQSSYGWHIVSCNYSIMTFLPRSSLPAEHASAVVPTALLVDSHWILIRWFH